MRNKYCPIHSPNIPTRSTIATACDGNTEASLLSWKLDVKGVTWPLETLKYSLPPFKGFHISAIEAHRAFCDLISIRFEKWKPCEPLSLFTAAHYTSADWCKSVHWCITASKSLYLFTKNNDIKLRWSSLEKDLHGFHAQIYVWTLKRIKSAVSLHVKRKRRGVGGWKHGINTEDCFWISTANKWKNKIKYISCIFDFSGVTGSWISHKS